VDHLRDHEEPPDGLSTGTKRRSVNWLIESYRTPTPVLFLENAVVVRKCCGI
jgi:hypothetical protein